MTNFKAVGPFGIFRLDDIQRAVPRETSEILLEMPTVPKSHIEDFKFQIVNKTLIQVELVVKSYSGIEEYESFIDTSNERATRRVINLDEEGVLKFFGFDAETQPPKKTATEAITKERSIAINVRIWMKKHKDYLRKTAEYDEAMSAMTAAPTDPNYNEEFAKVLKKAATEDERARFPTYVPKILEAMRTKLAELNEQGGEDFVQSLDGFWEKEDGDPVIEAKKELLAEYMASMFR